MSFFDEEFSLDDQPESTGGGDFEPVPQGLYQAKIAGAELKPTKAGNGEYVSVRFDITGPSHQGRVVFTNLNLQNPNPKAEEIGRGQLADIMRAIGLSRMKNCEQIIGGDLTIKVTVKNDPTYGPGNEVKGFKAIEGSTPPAAMAAATAPAADDTTPPWEK